MLNYPANYTLIGEEEMTYLEGGVSVNITLEIPTSVHEVFNSISVAYNRLNSSKWKKLFDWTIGNYLRDSVVMSDFRADLWSSMKNGNTDAFYDRYDKVGDYALIGRIGYAYGMFRVAETVIGFLK